jgi:two-component system, NtrC family, sensor histidine kinase AtoS
MTQRSDARPKRRATASVSPVPAIRAERRIRVRPAPTADDRFFRHIVNSMRNGVIAFRRDGSLALMNDEAYRIFGLTPRDGDIGRPFADVLRDRPDVIRVLGGAFELSHLPNRAELRLKDLDRVIGYTLSQVKDHLTEAPIGAVLFFKDLTRVEQLEERERLRDRLASLGEMAAGIAHELKNPLAGIEVMAGLLRRKVSDSPDAQSILNDIINEAKMANSTVMEMLDYVRPVRLERGRTALGAVLQTAVSMAESKAQRGEIGVEVAVPDDLPPIQGDEHQLCQVFTNLMINAFEALGGAGKVRVSATTGVMEGEHAPQGALAGEAPVHVPTLVIQVADDGPGIPPELTDRVFNAFFTTKAQGSGLGLAIVRKIIDAHDGRIDVTTAPGLGTTFTVTLPVCAEQEWFQ